MVADFDLVVVGSGFAGSLISMIARRLGYRVALVERGRHPRFAIGESTTPLANLILEELSLRYDLPALMPLTKWGAWRRVYPGLGCGLKRGFSFFHHAVGSRRTFGANREHQLLVAASPRDEIADTHWYRADLDHFLVREAQRSGAEFLEAWQPTGLELGPIGGVLVGESHGRVQRLSFRRLIDASGGGVGGSCVTRLLQLGVDALEGFPVTRTLYAHFRDIPRWAELHPSSELTPYPVDDSAMHHVFDEGWFWVLRFANGLTSAGVVMTDAAPLARGLKPTRSSWTELLAQFPQISEHLGPGIPEGAFHQQSVVGFRGRHAIAGPCVLLPSALGFVDPMFSTGFPLTLLGVERLAKGISGGDLGSEFEATLGCYERQTVSELNLTAKFMGAAYRLFSDFDSFRSLSMLYFTAAIYSETVRRLGKPELASGFLLGDHPVFGSASARCLEIAGTVPSRVFTDQVRRAIEPFELAGLMKSEAQHWYPASALPMLEGAAKVGVSPAEMQSMLDRVGFHQAQGLNAHCSDGS